MAMAMWRAVGATTGLHAPYDHDHFRDIAQAQTTADGHPFSDPFYKDEYIWYNPLVSWLIGGASWMSGIPPARLHLVLGPWLNATAPAGMYVLGSTISGPPAGLSAMIAFLFWRCEDVPSWTCATYSPWLFPSNFAQGVFYLAVAALLRYERVRRAKALALAAVLAGLVLLAHTAPAMILALTAIVLLARTPFRLLIFAGLGALVASPFWFWIIGHYRLKVRNPAPMEWPSVLPWPEGTAWLAPITLLALALTITGVRTLWHRQSSRVVVLAWMSTCVGFMIYRAIRDLGQFSWLPGVLPTFHFFLYLTALQALLIGGGSWALARRMTPGRWLKPVFLVSVLVLVAVRLPVYGASKDYVFGRRMALGRDRTYGRISAFLRQTSDISDVYLASDEGALFIVGPAGRKSVAVDPFFSNPYVTLTTRVNDRDRMLQLLKDRRIAAARPLLAMYDVSRVVGIGGAECDALRGAQPQLKELIRLGRVCVFLITGEDDGKAGRQNHSPIENSTRTASTTEPE